MCVCVRVCFGFFPFFLFLSCGRVHSSVQSAGNLASLWPAAIKTEEEKPGRHGRNRRLSRITLAVSDHSAWPKTEHSSGVHSAVLRSSQNRLCTNKKRQRELQLCNRKERLEPKVTAFLASPLRTAEASPAMCLIKAAFNILHRNPSAEPAGSTCRAAVWESRKVVKGPNTEVLPPHLPWNTTVLFFCFVLIQGWRLMSCLIQWVVDCSTCGWPVGGSPRKCFSLILVATT